MNPFLRPAIAITTLLLLHLFPLPTMTASPAYIMDEDGEPLLNDGTYYILPQTTANGGGLTVAPNNKPSPCPLYITQERDQTSNGLPVRISSPISSKYLPFGPTSFSFVSVTTTCTKSLSWRVAADNATGQFYVAPGTTQSLEPSTFSIVVPFNYVQPWNYQINYCDEAVCGGAGFFEENGLLGINNNIDFAVRFRKAFTKSPQFTSVM